MTTTAPRAAKVRSLRYDAVTGMLRLTVGQSVEAYSVHPLPTAAGVTQVALHKFAAADEVRYVVTLAGEVGRCSCPGHHYRGTCKHVAGIAALVSRGLLTAAE